MTVALALMGKKLRMTHRFDEQGNVFACTVIEAEPNIITQIKEEATDGYRALQMGWKKVGGKNDERKKKRIGKPRFGHFAKKNVEPRQHLFECRVDSTDAYKVGQELNLSAFTSVKFVDVTGISKGKGYQGAIKLHNYAGGRATHGSSFHRALGSTGPKARGCKKGDARASRMGGERVTVENLQVLGIEVEKNLLLVKGAIPGPSGARVWIRPAIKRGA